MTFRLVAVACALLLGLPALANPPYGQRTDVFRRLLFELGFQPLPLFAELHDNPSESLFIMLGDPKCLAKGFFPEGLRSFVEQGGAVLIATDKTTDGQAGKELSKLAGVTVTGESLVCLGEKPEKLYDALPDCPFVQPIAAWIPLTEQTHVLGMLAAAVGAGNRPALFRNPHPEQPDLRVATNAPSRLKVSGQQLPGGIYRLARLPQTCIELTIDLNALRFPGEKEERPNFVDKNGPLFAVGGTVGKGRVLVLADHSIFINRMMLPRDNGNLEFAANCLHWLRGGSLRFLGSPETINRHKVLFWDDGIVCTDFQVLLKTTPKPPALPPEPAIVAAIDKTIAKLEDSDAFNRALLEKMDELPGGRLGVVRYVVYLLTLAALLFLSYRFLWRVRHQPEPAAPLLTDALRDHEPSVSLLDQRRRTLLRSGNVWEMGHQLARECFASAGVAVTGASPPRVVKIQGGRWQRWRVNRRVARLWRLARGDRPRPISLTALQRWLRELEELKTALADGTIVLMGERPA